MMFSLSVASAADLRCALLRRGYDTMTAWPEWYYDVSFFGCPVRGEKKDLKSKYNSRFAAIIP